MPRDSRRARYLRRLKRERTLALRMLEHVIGERNTYRQILMDARQKYINQITEESKKAEAAHAAATEGEVVENEGPRQVSPVEIRYIDDTVEPDVRPAEREVSDLPETAETAG